MARTLINFRGTNDFALVDKRKGNTKEGTQGTKWASCEKSPFEKSNYVRYVRFTNFVTNEGGIVGGGFTGGIAGAIAGNLPGAILGTLVGAGIGSLDTETKGYGAWQPPQKPKGTAFTNFKKPCTPDNDVVMGFDEPDFNQFQQQYAAYLAGRNSGQGNATPLESE